MDVPAWIKKIHVYCDTDALLQHDFAATTSTAMTKAAKENEMMPLSAP